MSLTRGSGPSATEHEVAFCRSFIDPARRQRYQESLANPRRRREILDRLNHNLDLAASVQATPIPPAQRTDTGLRALLERLSAGKTCHVIADGAPLDGQDVTLGEGICTLLEHPFGVVLSLIPGGLAVYKSEDPAEWLLLRRPHQNSIDPR